MKRITVLLLLLICGSQVTAEQESASQRFVVRVAPRVTFAQPVVIEQPEPALSQTARPSLPAGVNQEQGDTVTSLSVASNAGLVIHFELARRSTKANSAGLKIGMHPENDGSWHVRVNEDGSAQASSRGSGCATFLFSTGADVDQLEIVATVICKE